MTRSTHIDFDCDTVDTAAFAEWQVLGIEMKEPQGRPFYWFSDDGELFKEIGSITVHSTGAIRLWPCERLLPAELDLLRGAGMEAFQHPPSDGACWLRERKKSGVHYWTCAVSFPASADDPFGHAVRAAETRCEQAARLLAETEDLLA
ncbi:hypothetical protein [Prescottella agglutinans]|uniref:Uncharacterized protein n=1 Tax=Prescottella agglutinans TaxID=1644129 RepID=A0ABT6MIJ6_9NOCA|nr:hypothetical protein [Prescottella agglutinans]MDH6283149.1 hypothetical protein [Prescottella agglutinans]